MFVWAYSLFHWLQNLGNYSCVQRTIYPEILIGYQGITVNQKYNGNAIITIATSTPPQDPSIEKKQTNREAISFIIAHVRHLFHKMAGVLVMNAEMNAVL